MSRASELLNDEGLRIDGRRAAEMRNLEFSLGIDEKILNKNCELDGKSIVNIGNTSVMTYVYGPRERTQKSSSFDEECVISVDYTVSPNSTAERKSRNPKSDRRLLESGITIKKIFQSVIDTHLYPNSEIYISIRVETNDGSTLAASINSVSLALVDAGISMKDYVCSASAGCVNQQPILDLNYFEESSSFDCPKYTLAVTPSNGKLLFVSLESRMHFEKFNLVRNFAYEIIDDIKNLMIEVTKTQVEELIEKRGLTF